MSTNFDVKVPIKDELKKSLIFGLGSRLPIGVILGFVGFRHDVSPLMQTISHSTRAYIWNADGMRGFLCKAEIIKMLADFDKNGELENVKKLQVLDLDTIDDELRVLQSFGERMIHLSKFYPCLYIFVLKYFDKTDRLEQYMLECKNFEGDP